ncbi:MAG TPA: glucose-1-phosphate cytidylyltransferase [Sphingomicrobium sp.]|jgi:glucose-1-phosphate cytidylyltransferase
MKAVILAGGLGTRLAEETSLRPKPMVEIGGRPIIWHIMKIYSSHGINDFIICCGYKGWMLKEYFTNYMVHSSDMTIDVRKNIVDYHESYAEPWRVTLIDTGEATMTGGRLKQIAPFVAGEDAFCMTYGDGLSNIDIAASIAFHRAKGTKATLTAVYPPGRFGGLDLHDGKVRTFKEKPRGDGSMINGGYFVLSPEVLDYIDDDGTVWEAEPLERLAQEGNLAAYPHAGFWQPMDTLRDKIQLEDLWQSGIPPWKTW